MLQYCEEEIPKTLGFNSHKLRARLCVLTTLYYTRRIRGTWRLNEWHRARVGAGVKQLPVPEKPDHTGTIVATFLIRDE
ncbi:hypothetical protein NDU88_003019 [Pleurodeles waltl]|uniref:Integrase n=1 Tax=Pleurodeles waltl TaxID=8319 RepID=A0AAV7T3W8_PLEWA|nr:hypothetical protein NDU88_003019 [Pleurodeles waltl]